MFLTPGSLVQITKEPFQDINKWYASWAMDIRGCQIGMQGPELCAEPRHFCKLDVATSRIAILDLNLSTCSTSCHFKFKQLRALCSTKLHLWHPLMDIQAYPAYPLTQPLGPKSSRIAALLFRTHSFPLRRKHEAHENNITQSYKIALIGTQKPNT